MKKKIEELNNEVIKINKYKKELEKLNKNINEIINESIDNLVKYIKI